MSKNPALARYADLLSPAALAELEAALTIPLPPALRINALKNNPISAAAGWSARYGWEAEPVEFCAAGLRFNNRPPTPLSQTLEYKMGAYYIQDAASMLPAELFSPHPAPLILDLAAAPGGKTTHLVDRFGDRGLIIANDKSRSRLAALRSNLQTWGALGALVTNYEGGLFGTWYPETFDRILLDAPCSGDTLRENKGRKTRSVSPKEGESIRARQIALLRAAYQALKVGGELVYSTCTLSPDENESVIDELLRQFSDASLIDLRGQLPNLNAAGLTQDGDQSYNPQLRGALRLWPQLYATSGFFAALIRKDASLNLSPTPPPAADHGLSAIRPKELNRLADQLAAYGFHLEKFLAEYDLGLWRRVDNLYAIPQRLMETFGALPHAGAGLMIGQFQSDESLIPSQELISRFDTQFSQRRLTVAADQVAPWLSGLDLRELSSPDLPSDGMVLLQDPDGRFIGRGKVIPGRVRNLLTKRTMG